MTFPFSGLVDFLVILCVLVVLFSLISAFWTYLKLRERELAWKKAGLISEVVRQMEINPAMQRAREILSGSNPLSKLEDILGGRENVLSATELELKRDLDSLFGTLQRIAHAATRSKTLSRDEAQCFSWYFREIQRHPVLSKYFYTSGFLDLWDFAASWGEKLGPDIG